MPRVVHLVLHVHILVNETDVELQRLHDRGHVVAGDAHQRAHAMGVDGARAHPQIDRDVIEIVEAAHPVPDAAGALAARRMLETVEGQSGRHEERLALERALCELPPEQREVVHLKAFEGMTFQEIADAIGESINTVASRYRYAMEKMRAQLG